MAASVTYPAPSRASSQLSVVVTVPSAVRFSRSQVIFGAAKYGSSGRPVIAVSSAERSASRAQTPPDRRSCQTIAGDSGRAGAAVPGQHGLALVGQRHRVGRRAARRGQRLPPRRHDRLEQLLRVGLHPVRARRCGCGPGPRRGRAPRRPARPAAPWSPTCPGRSRGRSPLTRLLAHRLPLGHQLHDVEHQAHAERPEHVVLRVPELARPDQDDQLVGQPDQRSGDDRDLISPERAGRRVAGSLPRPAAGT